MKLKLIINNQSKLIFFSAIFCLLFNSVYAQQKAIKIWPSSAPGTEGRIDSQKIVNNRVYKVYQPALQVYLTQHADPNNPGILIFPGGGYTHVTIIKEGEKVAHWLNKLGISAFVLTYRLNQKEALEDAERAMSLIRSRANRYNLNTDNIGILGFSAGGHLALNLAEHYAQREKYLKDKIDFSSCKPDFMILGYPQADSLATSKYVNDSIPPAFIFQAADDHTVSIQTSETLFHNLHELGIYTELHIFANGGHGFGLGKKNESLSKWTLLCKDWMQSLNIINEK